MGQLGLSVAMKLKSIFYNSLSFYDSHAEMYINTAVKVTEAATKSLRRSFLYEL